MNITTALRRLLRGQEAPAAVTAAQVPSANYAASSPSSIPGFAPIPAGTYDVYRRIAAHPTVALVRSIVVGPVLAGGWSYIKRDASIPDQFVTLVQNNLDPLRPDLLRDGLKALDFGWAPFELVYQVRDGQIALAEAKPLAWDYTSALFDAAGNWTGLQNQPPGAPPVQLLGAKAFTYVYDAAVGDPYGRSRHENIRRRWAESEQIVERLAQYLKKVAGLVVQLHYPDGTSKDAAGADRPNQWIAQSVLDAVSAGKSVMFPNLFASGDDPRTAADLAGKSQWNLSAFDAGGADQTPGMLSALQYYDNLLFRGWLRPERVGLESQHGSRADAGTHTDTGATDSVLIDRDFARAVSRGIVDPLLELNFGPTAKGAIRIEPTPIDDDAIENDQATLQTLLANPQTAPQVMKLIDVPALLRELSIPLK